MTIGRIITISVGALFLGLIAGIITRNIFVGVAFPFLLLAFFLIWKTFKADPTLDQFQSKSEEIKTDVVVEKIAVDSDVKKELQNPSVPVTDTSNYPPRQI